MEPCCWKCEGALRRRGVRFCADCSKDYTRQKGRAYGTIHRAVLKGQISPATTYQCMDCDAPATDYDHRDYDAPLDVEPVCRSCNLKRGPTDAFQKFKSSATTTKTSPYGYLT